MFAALNIFGDMLGVISYSFVQHSREALWVTLVCLLITRLCF